MSPLTGVLREAWELYRRFAVHFLAISFAIFLVAGIIEALLVAFASAAGWVLAAIVAYIALFLVESALVTAVQDVRDGRVDLDLGQTVSAALPFVGPVALASVLAGIGITIGFALLIVPGLVLLTFWSLIVPSIVVGGARPLEAFSRSWRTVRGYAWQVFGTYVLVFLIWVVVRIALTLVLFALPVVARDFLSNIVADTLFSPFLALAVTLIYFRLTAAHATASPAAPGGGFGGPPGPGYQPPPASPYGQTAPYGQPAEPPATGQTAAPAAGQPTAPYPQTPASTPPASEGWTEQTPAPTPPASGGWTEPPSATGWSEPPPPPAPGMGFPPPPVQPPAWNATEPQPPAAPPADDLTQPQVPTQPSSEEDVPPQPTGGQSPGTQRTDESSP